MSQEPAAEPAECSGTDQIDHKPSRTAAEQPTIYGNGNGHNGAGPICSLTETLPLNVPLARPALAISQPVSRSTWPGLALVFSSTILVSAFLLFQVQPLISKYILPWFGGSPAVWTTCMLFFQLTLFCGYLYAHLLTRFLSPRAQGIVHLLLIAAAVALMLPSIAPGVQWKPLDSSHPTGRILLLLSATVGLPYFVLSTTGPLVQAWFARTWPGHSPYRLYALSNAGSLAGLLTFPFLFEAAFDSDTQAALWTAAFGLFALLCASSAVWILRFQKNQSEPTEIDAVAGLVAANDSAPARVTAGRRLLWIGLPACASLLLLATTNFVCQDVAVIPFLWVLPLALYLLTFVITFDHPRWYRPLPMSLLAIALLVLAAGGADDFYKSFIHEMGFVPQLILDFGAMFVACLVCHGQLVRLRPDPAHLTEYYLMISAGGALGGIFVSLIAPQVFATHFEWTLGLGLALALAACVAITRMLRARQANPANRALSVAGVGVVALSLVAGSYWLLRGTLPSSDLIYEARNFYGTVCVYESDRDDPKFHRRTFFSGSTAHGKQLLEPDKRRIPIAYFGAPTGVGRTLKYYEQQPNLRVGVVGLGVGEMAAYAKAGDYYRFYEINEHVDNIARNYFTYLQDCPAKWDIVLADARLELESELAHGQPQQFDVLALDAFSGDALPVHLLTDEAFATYVQHLKPDGVIVVNITNRYINMVPVINAVAKKYGFGTTRVMTRYEEGKLLNRTDFMMLSKNQKFLDALPPVYVQENLQPEFEVPLWTDKYSNLFGILKR